jgi:SET and MYND domain-containing protein 4
MLGQEKFEELFSTSMEMEKCLKFYEALVALNKSSMAAAEDSTALSKVFLKKSQIYYKLGHFQNSLNCLEEVEKLITPDDEVKFLIKQCRSSLKIAEQSENVLRNILKLSHPQNPNIPFIIDCLELKNDEKYGKYIITNRDLIAGDVIAIEESHFHFVSSKSIFERCFNCFRINKLDLKSFKTPGEY